MHSALYIVQCIVHSAMQCNAVSSGLDHHDVIEDRCDFQKAMDGCLVNNRLGFKALRAPCGAKKTLIQCI